MTDRVGATQAVGWVDTGPFHYAGWGQGLSTVTDVAWLPGLLWMSGIVVDMTIKESHQVPTTIVEN